VLVMKLTVRIGWICLATVSLAILVLVLWSLWFRWVGTLPCIVRTVSPRPGSAFSAC
jgi:hypothetical protein